MPLTANNKTSFIETQYAFTAHIRDPKNIAAPDDIEDRRINIYRELFYNNIEDLIATNFPVLRTVIADEQWHSMVRDFFIHHKSKTPLFPEFAQEFIQYLQHERVSEPEDPPFMLELAHYEWLELALNISEDEDKPDKLNTNGDIVNGIPVVSVLAIPLAYQFPVHQISPDYIPQQPGEIPTFLIINRDLQDNVHFLEINAVTFRLLEILKENENLTGLDVLEQIAEELGDDNHDAVIENGRNLLNDLRSRQIILGTINP